jgi:hypothetical protein
MIPTQHARSANSTKGQKGQSWEGGYRVPKIIRWPGHVKAWRVLTRSMYQKSLTGAAELEHVHTVVVGFDDSRQRSPLAKRGYISCGKHRSQRPLFAIGLSSNPPPCQTILSR